MAAIDRPICEPSARARRAAGFTLIELLVVVAIIAALLAIMLPSLKGAMATAKRTVCASQVRQLVTASLTYAADYRGSLPYRGELDFGAPHNMYHTDYDLNVSFFDRYMHIANEPHATLGLVRVNDAALFCPGEIIQVRYPGLYQPGLDYRRRWITYQYTVMPPRNSVVWMHTNALGADYQPSLRNLAAVPRGRWMMWGDAAVNLTAVSAGPWLGHDAPYRGQPPTGMNAGFFDGSVSWTRFADLAVYWQETATTQRWYWPKPRD